MGEVVSLLDRDVYALGQVDRLLGLSLGAAGRWIDGYERRGRRYEPLVRVEATGSEIVTWGEFVKARLLGIPAAGSAPRCEDFGTYLTISGFTMVYSFTSFLSPYGNLIKKVQTL